MTEQQITEALQKLDAIELFKRSDAYKLLILPLQAEIDSLKNAYDCKTLQELATLKGLKQGLSFVTDQIESIIQSGDSARLAGAELQKRKEFEAQEIDSTDL